MRQGVLHIVQVVFILIARAQYQSRLYCKDYLFNEGWKSWNSYGEKVSLYHFVSSPLSNNSESESHCVQYGAKLSTAKSGEEIAFLKSLSPDISNRTIYIGLMRNALDNRTWTWNDENVAAEIIWNTGFPQEEHNCGCIYCIKDACGLVSSQCDVKREFICKYAVVSEILNVSILADIRDVETKMKWNQIPFNGTSQTWLRNLILGLLPDVDWTITTLSYTIEGNVIRIDLMIDKSAMDSANISAIENSMRNILKTPTQPWNYRSFGNGASIEPSSETVVNGSLFHLTCTCQSESVAVLEWVYEGINLNEQNAKKNIQFKVTHNVTKGFLSSTLTFQPVLKEDSGIYECIVTTYKGCILAKSGIRVYVRVPAVVDIFPLRTSVEQGSNASIICALRNNTEHVSFLWFRNGTQLGNESGFTVSLINRSVSQLYIMNVTMPAKYSCRGDDADVPGNESIAYVDVIIDFMSYCKSSVDERGTRWIITFRGDTCKQPCPTGYTGTSTRFCNADGKWEDPSYDQCVNNAFVRLQIEVRKSWRESKSICLKDSSSVIDRLSRLKMGSVEILFVSDVSTSDHKVYSHNGARQNGFAHYIFIRFQNEKLESRVLITNLSTVLETLIRVTDPVKVKLLQAELDIAVSILNRIVDIEQIDKMPASEDVYENFLHAASNIVDETTSASWKSLITKKQRGAESVLRTVENFVEGLSQSVSNESSFHLAIRTKNIDVEIGQKLPIRFPNDGDDGSQGEENFSNSLSLPSQKDVENTDQYTYAVAFYRNLSGILQKKILTNGLTIAAMDNIDIGPVVMSVQLYPRPDKLTSPLRLTFPYFDTETNNMYPLCTFWSFSMSENEDEGWSSEGCHVFSRNSSGVVCECNHLTNFAILMTPYTKVTTADHEASLSIISAIGCAVSLTCLVLTIMGHLCVWRHVKSPRRYILMNFSVALILSYLTFLVGVNRTENKDVCTAIAALLHYFYLTVFFLMLVEGIWIAVSVLFVFYTRSYLHLLLPAGWLIPVGIVGVSLGVKRLDGYGSKQFCWLSVKNGLIWAFVGPAALIIAFNIVIIIVAVRKMLGTTAFITKTKKEQIRASLKSLGVLLPITGVTWILGIFSLNEDLVVFQYLFTIFNSLQGLFIFVFHCFLDDQLRNAIKRKYQRTKATEINYLNLKSASRDEVNNDALTSSQHGTLESTM